MRLFADYKNEVIDTFIAKRAAGRLPLPLIEPTPAGLRDECLSRYREAHSQKDEESLKIFFGTKGNAADYYRLIETMEIDKFRPLVSFFRNPSINTKNKNIELLAYLIDFEPRPFQFRYNEPEAPLPPPPKPEQPAEPSKSDIGEGSKRSDPSLKLKEKVDEPKDTNPQRGRYTSARMLIIVIAIAVIGGIAMTIKPTHMYWTGNEYKRVFFWTALEEAQLVPFDENLFRNFKRITRRETIKKRDIYNVWYAKLTRDSIEFYTDSAAHPIDTTKTLKPMTEYIWTTWIVNKTKRGSIH